jgi:hypothetical protein
MELVIDKEFTTYMWYMGKWGRGSTLGKYVA